MKLVNKKTRKALRKSVSKAIRKHGPAIIAGVASGIAGVLAEESAKHGKLGRAIERVEDSLGYDHAHDDEDDDPKQSRHDASERASQPA